MWSQNKQLPYVLIAPASLFLAVFFLYPFLSVITQAFEHSSSDGYSLKNFQDVFSHWKFSISLENTLLLTAAVVPVQLALALLMATMVNGMTKGRDFVLYLDDTSGYFRFGCRDRLACHF